LEQFKVNDPAPVCIGDFFELINGFAFPSAQFSSLGIPVIKIKNVKAARLVLNDLSFVPPRFLAERPDKIVQHGDLLITMSGNRLDGTPETWVGKVAQFRGREHILVNQRVGILRPKNAKVVPRFFEYALSTNELQRHFISVATSSGGQANLSPSQILSTEIDVPPEPQRRAIAEVLGSLDDKIEQNRRTGRKLEELARAVFKAWFVDFEPVKAKAAGATIFPGLPPAAFASLPARLVDSELGPVPEGWKVSNLEQATSRIETGKRPKGGVKGIECGVPSIGAESITRIAEYDFGKTKFVPEEFFQTMKKGVVEDRDVLLYKDGGRPGDFQPHVSMFGRGFPFERMCINEHVFRIRAKAPLTQNYMYLWLSSDGVMDEMRRRGTGVAIPGLSANAARELRTLVPDKAVVEAFDSVIDPMFSLCLTSASESRKLAALRDYLLPKLLSGQVRVREAEKCLAESA
jgi:type I restriction enzyme S subunit